MDLPQPPLHFVTLNQAEASSTGCAYNVIGICVDHLPAAKSRGTDETVKFTLWDPSWYSSRGMNFRFFAPTKEKLPAIENNGDVVLLTTVTNRTFGSSSFGISNHGTNWYVFSGSSVLSSTCPNGSDIRFVSSHRLGDRYARPSIGALQYIKALSKWADPDAFRPPSKATALEIESIMIENGGTPLPRKDKWRLLQDLHLDKNNAMRFKDGRPAFADLFGEVRRIYTGDHRRVDLYLTDYTSNSKFYNYQPSGVSRDGDQYGYLQDNKSWLGPWGKMTIEVHLWDAHAVFARTEVKEGSVVLLKNCHIKFDPNGSKLEAVCRGDRDDISKVNVMVYQSLAAAKDERFSEFARRKREYEAAAVEKGLLVAPRPSKNARKRQVEEDEKGMSEKTSMSKNKKKKNRKTKPQSQVEVRVHPVASGSTVNQHVRCNAVEIPITPLQKLLDLSLLKRLTQNRNEFFLPFQNSAYKCKVRVIDYYPEDIADFAAQRSGSLSRALSVDDLGDENVVDGHGSPSQETNQWEWRFMLLVEDATLASDSEPRARIPLLIVGENGEYLLRKGACDLKNNPEALAYVTEKLFILWGDLQERKEEKPNSELKSPSSGSSMPFECLIEEYGIPIATPGNLANVSTDYRRLFQMFSTTVV